MSNPNVLKDFSEWAKTAKLRNPDTNLDEVRIFVLAVLYGVTAYILGTGLYYHYEIFSIASSNARLAITVAVILFVIGEVGKLKFFSVLMWGIFSGDFYQNWRKLLAYFLILLFVAGAYYWSWNISTNAAPTLNGIVNKSSKMGSIGGDSTEIKALEAELALMTSRINDAKSAEQKGFNIKYRGVVTQEGQKIANKNADVKSKLITQESSIRASLSAAKERLTSYKEAQFSSAASQLGEYGGYGELAQILLSLISSLILFELYTVNKNKKSGTPANPAPVFSPITGVQTAVSNTTPQAAQRDSDGGIYTYIQGYIKVSERNKYYEPTQFINWLRNSFNRNNQENVNKLRADLMFYIQNEQSISPKIAAFIKKYPLIAGDEIVNTANTGIYTDANRQTALHESGHFVCFAYFKDILKVKFTEMAIESKDLGGGFSEGGHLYFTNGGTDSESYLIGLMAGFAADFIAFKGSSKLSMEAYFNAHVKKVENIEGSDTYIAQSILKKHKGKDLEEYFYDAIDILHGNIALLNKVSNMLLEKKKLNAAELEQLAQEVKPVEGFELC